MIFNINNAGIPSSTIYNQTKIILSQQTSNQLPDQPKKIFIVKDKPSFSTSSANRNIPNNINIQTQNGK